MIKRKFLLCLLCQLASAQFLVQASYGQQISPTLVRMSGYNVDFEDGGASPYDVGVGYMFNFKNMLVMPVVLEANPESLSALSSYDEAKVSLTSRPLELHLKPGLRFDEHELYGMVGFQLGQFSQAVSGESHNFELTILPNFYGAGYSHSVSEFFDYLAEVKFYYKSAQAYALDNSQLDDSLEIVDASCRFGLRLKL